MEPNDQILGDTSMEIGGRRGTSTPATARGVACRRRRRQKKKQKTKKQKKNQNISPCECSLESTSASFPESPSSWGRDLGRIDRSMQKFSQFEIEIQLDDGSRWWWLMIDGDDD